MNNGNARWAFLFFLLALPLINAAPPSISSCFNDSARNVSTGFEMFDNFYDGTINSSIWAVSTAGGGTITESSGFITINAGTDSTTYLYGIPSFWKNYTVEYQMNVAGGNFYFSPMWNATRTKQTFASTEPGSFILNSIDFGGINKIGWLTDLTKDGGTNEVLNQNFVYSTGQTYNITLYVNQTGGVNLWIDKTLILANSSFYSGWTLPSGNNSHLRFASANSGNDKIGMVRVFNGTSCPAPLEPTQTPNITLSATDLYDSSSITSFSASIARGGIVIYNASTTNGSIGVNNITNGFANITFQSSQSGGYFERTYNNVNISDNTLSGELYQAIAYFNASEVITGTPITNFWANAPLQINKSNSTGWATLFLKAGNYNISGNSTGYLNSTLSLSVSPLQTSYNTFEFGTNRLRVDALSIINGAYISSFTIRLTNNSYSTSSSTTNGNVSFSLMPGTYYLNFSSATHANMNASIVVSSSSIYPNYTFSVYTTNSINFTILHEQTGLSFIGTPVNIEIISSIFSQNYTSNTSFFYVDLLNPYEYLIRWSAENYDQRTYYFYLSNGTNNQINLYMLPSNLSSQLLQQVIDQDGNNVVDAYIKVYRYFFSNNAYSVREIGKTNSDGIAGLNVILNDEFYYFTVQKPLGNTIYTTTPTYIYSTTTDAIQVNIGSSFAQKYFNTIETTYNLSFNPTTSSFRFFWDDPRGMVSEGCLNIYRVGLSADTLVNSSCDSSSSSTIILRVANTSGATYRAEAFFGFSPADNLISELSYFFPTQNPMGSAGLLFVILLTLVVFFISVMSGSLAIGVLLSPIPALFASLSGFIDISASMVIPIQIAAIVVAWVIGRR